MAKLTISRRAIIVASLFAPALLSARHLPANRTLPAELTPECDDGDATPEQTAGPYYKPRSPLKDDFKADVLEGDTLLVGGNIYSSDCRLISNCMIEFWQADSTGQYDNEGFRLRGHQYTDADGRYVLQTIVPGLYPGRTRHIHVRVRPENGPMLTTQLYFPHEQRNGSDGLFRSELLINFDQEPRVGRFNFVVRSD